MGVRTGAVVVVLVTGAVAVDSSGVLAQDAVRKPPGPLQRLIRGLFRPARGGLFEEAADAKAEDEGKRGENDRDYIDSRAPQDRRAQQILREARQAAGKGQWGSAVELIQRILDQPQDSLYRVADQRWESVRWSANRLLGEAPAPVKADYQVQNGGLAEQLARQARQSGDPQDLVAVATRFYHTAAGREAANRIAGIHLDRGEFNLAAWWYGGLLQEGSPLAKDATWLAKVEYAARQSGNEDLLKRVKPAAEGLRPVIAGRPRPAWADAASPLGTDAVKEPALSDARMIYGTPSRLGTWAGAAPLLIPEHHWPLTGSPELSQTIAELVREVGDQGRYPLPANQPLAVDGKFVYRDLTGVWVVDAVTGKRLWQTADTTSPEELLTGNLPQRANHRFNVVIRRGGRMPNNFDQNLAQGQTGDYHPLATLLCREGNYNTLSSDGRRLYVVEGQAVLTRNGPGNQWGGNGEGSKDQFGQKWNSNRIVSYDLATGRQLWVAGGIEPRDRRPSAGGETYFLGVPVPDQGELLTVALVGNEIQVVALSPETGVVRWSQLIAYADTKIEDDVCRRWFTNQVAVSEGIAVCPTTVGWLVAVDRLRQTVLWAYRYQEVDSDRQFQNGETNFQSFTDLGGIWQGTAPIITGRHVIYAAPESENIVCLDLATGTPKWERSRDEMVGVAGVFGGRVVVYSSKRLRALKVEDGEEAWECELEDGKLLSGRGVAVGPNYLAPVHPGELLTVSLEDGTVVESQRVAENGPALGNLVVHGGRVASVGLDGLSIFPEKPRAVAAIEEGLRRRPVADETLFRQAQMILLEKKYAEADRLLAELGRRESAPAELRDKARRLRWDTLMAMKRESVLPVDGIIAELESLADTPAQRMAVQMLRLDTWEAAGDFQRVAETLETFLQQPRDVRVARSDDEHTEVALRDWAAARLADLWRERGGEGQKDYNEALLKRAETLAAGPTDAWEEWREAHAFHPDVRRLAERRYEATSEGRPLADVELWLTREADDAEPARRRWARLQLVREYLSRGLVDDARHAFDRFAADLNSQPFAGRSAADWERELMPVGDEAAPVSALAAVGVPRAPWKDEVTGATYRQMAQEVLPGSPLPYFDRFLWQIDHSDQRLLMTDKGTGRVHWAPPLRSAARPQHSQYSAAGSAGHLLYVLNRDSLQALSPLNRQVVWSHTLGTGTEGQQYPFQAQRPEKTPMADATSGASSIISGNRQAVRGQLAVVNSAAVVYLGHRQVTVLDPATGVVRWKRGRLPQSFNVLATNEIAVVSSPDLDDPLVLRISDGKPLSLTGLEELLPSAVAVVGNHFLLWEQKEADKLFGLVKPKSQLRLYHPVTKETRWTLGFPRGAVAGELSPDEWVVKSPGGDVQGVELEGGTLRPLTGLKGTELTAYRGENYLFADARNVYLVANNTNYDGMRFAESLPSVRAHGLIVAWDRRTRELKWKRKVSSQHMVIDRFAEMPLLLLASRRWVQKGDLNYSMLNLEALDRDTGESRLTLAKPFTYGGFHSIQLYPGQPVIDMVSYNMRLRLRPDSGAAPAQPEVKVSHAETP